MTVKKWIAGLAIGAIAVPLLLAGCGGSSEAERAQAQAGEVEWVGPMRPIPGLRQRVVGAGPSAAVLVWSRGREAPPRDAVVFLHGWMPLPPYLYGGWIAHLAGEGNTVLYPVYQDLETKSADYLENALAGIDAGLGAFDADPASVVAVGYNTGAALAFDYAATAAEEGLPAPLAVFAAYPGRYPPNGTVTPADLSRIPAATRLAAVSGPGNRIPGGDAEARALLRDATRVPPRRRELLSAPFAARGNPAADTPAHRRAFQIPFDRLVAEARGEQ